VRKPSVSASMQRMTMDEVSGAARILYELIVARRDVRHFVADAEIDERALRRVLQAAHLAPSVGFSQPWDFIIIHDRARRARIRDSFLACRDREATRFEGERRAKYLAYRLEGILEAALNVCVTVDLRILDRPVLGATAQPETLRMSVCCAVQNFWLAARAEEIGVGWVSILEPAVLRAELALPAGVEPVAYLCVGRAEAFAPRPVLEETGWAKRRPLEEIIHHDQFTRR
jgi:5,6-dimethylbenzimidazole synthase